MWQCRSEGRRFAYALESRIQATKRSGMGSAFLQGDRFADAQKLLLQTAIYSDMGSVTLQEFRSADAQESSIQAAERRYEVFIPERASIC